MHEITESLRRSKRRLKEIKEINQQESSGRKRTLNFGMAMCACVELEMTCGHTNNVLFPHEFQLSFLVWPQVTTFEYQG